MANHPQISVDVTPSLATTTDGTSTVTVLTSAMHDTTGGESITYDILGYDFTNNEVASAKVAVKVTNVGGSLTIVGTPVHLIPIQVGSSSGLSTASVTVVLGGSNVLVNVIGVTGRTIKWVAYRNPAVEVLNSWTAVPTPANNYIPTWSSANTRWEPLDPSAVFGSAAGGDLTGNYPTPTVTKITQNNLDIGLEADANTTIRQKVLSGANPTGTFNIYGRDSLGTYDGGDINIQAGTGASGTHGGDISIFAGAKSVGGVNNGHIVIGADTNKYISLESENDCFLGVGINSDSSTGSFIGLRSESITLDSDSGNGLVNIFGAGIEISTDGYSGGGGSIDINTTNTNATVFVTSSGTNGLVRLQGESTTVSIGSTNAIGMIINLGNVSSTYLNLDGLNSGAATSNQLGTTVGAAGGASALPATPLGYLRVKLNGSVVAIPYYTAS